MRLKKDNLDVLRLKKNLDMVRLKKDNSIDVLRLKKDSGKRNMDVLRLKKSSLEKPPNGKDRWETKFCTNQSCQVISAYRS